MAEIISYLILNIGDLSITHEFERAYKQWKDNEITGEAMKKVNVPRSTFYRIVK